jgi:hypothetical protein
MLTGAIIAAELGLQSGYRGLQWGDGLEGRATVAGLDQDWRQLRRVRGGWGLTARSGL